jgi:hypothetical protein
VDEAGRALLAKLRRRVRAPRILPTAVVGAGLNEPAIGFYRSIGAEPMDEWTVYRITGRTLTSLARDR